MYSWDGVSDGRLPSGEGPWPSTYRSLHPAHTRQFGSFLLLTALIASLNKGSQIPYLFKEKGRWLKETSEKQEMFSLKLVERTQGLSGSVPCGWREKKSFLLKTEISFVNL